MATNLPIACTLTPDALSARKAGLLARVVRQATARVDLEDERACCRFLRFTLIVEPDGGPLSLTLTGPPGTRDFLDALLDS